MFSLSNVFCVLEAAFKYGGAGEIETGLRVAADSALSRAHYKLYIAVLLQHRSFLCRDEHFYV